MSGQSASSLKHFFRLLMIVASCAFMYGLLAIISLGEPVFNWGAVHRGWEQFSYHVFGKQYSVWMFSGEPGAVSKQFGTFLRLLPANTAYGGVACSIWGMIVLYRSVHLRPLLVFFVLMIVCGVGYSVNYSIHDIDSYFLSSFVALLISAAIGLYELSQRLSKTIFVAALVPLIAFGTNLRVCDQHGNYLVREYVRMMIDPLPVNSVILSQQWDYFCSAFWYMQQVEGYRPDIVLIEKELLRRTWYPAQLQRWYGNAIRTSTSEIESYMTDLREFEQNSELFLRDPVKTRTIQNKFITLLNSLVTNNLNQRSVFVTPEIFEGETGFAEGLIRSPFGLCIQLSREENIARFDTTLLQFETFANSAKKYNHDALETGIITTASRELLSNVSYLVAKGQPARARWFCTVVLSIDASNSTAQRLLQTISPSSPSTE